MATPGVTASMIRIQPWAVWSGGTLMEQLTIPGFKCQVQRSLNKAIVSAIYSILFLLIYQLSG
jgi:hypothetical protein